MLPGTYTLVSFTLLDPKTGEERPWGRRPHGILIYTSDGYVSVAINKEPEPSANPLDQMLFYAGRYAVEGQTIVHRIQNASDSSRIGKELRREMHHSGDLLVLTGSSASGNPFKLTWKRA